MGVYLCLGYQSYDIIPENYEVIKSKINLQDINKEYSKKGKIIMQLGEASHKIKKKAEQVACMNALEQIIE